MGLYDLLLKGYTNLGVGKLPGDKNSFNSATGPKPADQYRINPGVNSKLHNEYSITGTPQINGVRRSPSGLDLDGEKPADRYEVNAPEGRGVSIVEGITFRRQEA